MITGDIAGGWIAIHGSGMAGVAKDDYQAHRPTFSSGTEMP